MAARTEPPSGSAGGFSLFKGGFLSTVNICMLSADSCKVKDMIQANAIRCHIPIQKEENLHVYTNLWVENFLTYLSYLTLIKSVDKKYVCLQLLLI